MIEIVSGPMKGYSGIFDSYSTKGRITILLDLLGKETSVQLAALNVESNKYALSS